ncbi:Neuronal acetylcholine receptor subunit alpha-7 [Mizuhopecten yessoensis]|uniref:Neuronal acetylcholine receptor subunit alpha-7 n=1 Tax=Mizuhopecten yessoensis TaxID=6573 RepID=A0A210QPE7_MIZYE|nr:Neuronal acetylcholine receptor subunit alpha-7 [Mizuhopecten yessoensis]
MELTWIDEFLILRDGVKSLQLPRSEIWYPDVALFNSIDDPQHISDGQHTVLLENGRVLWYPGRQYSVNCQIDIRRFPFDEQTCQVQIGSWQTPVWIQRIADTGRSLNEIGYEKNGEWEIIGRITQPEYNENLRISYVTYEIHFRRHFLYPVINTLFPVVLLSFLNTLVFLLPARSGEKMTLSISVFLSFTVFLTVFNDMMPKLSTTISYLSIYLCVQLGLSGLALVESICIWRINDRENKATANNLSPEPFDNSLSTQAEDIIYNQQNIQNEDNSFERHRQISSTHENSSNNNDIHKRSERRSTKWLSVLSVKQTYSVNTEESTGGCQLNSDRLDLMCFWLHFGITSTTTTILMVMFWL